MRDVRKEYINNFFGSLSEEEKESIYFDNFMWHAFSYDKIPAIEGILAIEEFKKNEKNNVYILFQSNDIVLEKDNLTYEELISIIEEDTWTNMDCYVVDKEFNWTFVCTHETYIPGIFDLEEEEERDFEEFPSIGPFFANKLK